MALSLLLLVLRVRLGSYYTTLMTAAHLLGGTLLAPPRPEGPYVPTLNVIQGVAAPVVSALKRGESVTASLDIVTGKQSPGHANAVMRLRSTVSSM